MKPERIEFGIGAGGANLDGFGSWSHVESNSDPCGKASDQTCSMSKPVVEVQVPGVAATSAAVSFFLAARTRLS
jgi:hypothetical protein